MSEAEEIEDDPGELIEWLVIQHEQMDDTQRTKEQLRWALEKLIDERVAKALEAHACRATTEISAASAGPPIRMVLRDC